MLCSPRTTGVRSTHPARVSSVFTCGTSVSSTETCVFLRAPSILLGRARLLCVVGKQAVVSDVPFPRVYTFAAKEVFFLLARREDDDEVCFRVERWIGTHAFALLVESGALLLDLHEF